MKRRLILMAPVALSACGSLLPKQAYVPRVSWPLAPTPPAQRSANPAGPLLLVRDLAPAPGLEARGLQTLNSSGSVTVDYYNNWAVDPAAAVTQALNNWAQASGLFSAVIAPGSRLVPNFILEGELTELYADELASVARVTLTQVIIRNNPALGALSRPISQTRLSGTAPLSGASPAAQVAAERLALAQVLTQAIQSLSTSIAV